MADKDKMGEMFRQDTYGRMPEPYDPDFTGPVIPVPPSWVDMAGKVSRMANPAAFEAAVAGWPMSQNIEDRRGEGRPRKWRPQFRTAGM